RPASDLDVAVVQRDPLDAFARLDAAVRMAETLGRDVDLLDFARLSPVMQVQVLATGRRLFSDDAVADLVDAARALRDYQDLQRWRGPMTSRLVDRLIHAGGAA
ncbi:MAG: nucleotidyltransferase domain-containing protein, partial [Rubrivivax sp.]|nr:nucleotidyltransferase domain-containing protein [Rubrivivax sp.]